jgi:hypothetical protein
VEKTRPNPELLLTDRQLALSCHDGRAAAMSTATKKEDQLFR